MERLEWRGAPVCRRLSGGVTLAVPAPVDLLYTACTLIELAWQDSIDGIDGRPAPAIETRAAELTAMAADEARPDLVLLEAAAGDHGVTFLRGDELVSIGLGASGRCWAETEPPAPGEVEWGELKDVPLALVTGTNGKTTVVRMLARVLRTAGFTTGVTTTDYVAIDDDVIETGDCTGPQSARRALRHPSVTAAALEVARGGILRRGLAVPRAPAVAVTNVAADHLGEYGVNTVAELADVKFAVHRALGEGGLLVTSAEDALCTARATALAPDLAARGAGVGLTALTPDHPALREHDGQAATIAAGQLALRRHPGEEWAPVVSVEAIRATFGGRAAYNVRNALITSLLARALGVDDASIAAGLSAFRGDSSDNPGRGNIFDIGHGARALVDFAHNAHGMDALGALAWSLPARRRLVMLSQPGDRRDAEITAFARAAARLGADRYVVTDLPDYLRGREPGELPALLKRALAEAGVAPDRLVQAPDPVAGVRAALDWAGPDDLLVLSLLSGRAAAFDLLETADTGA
jgi:UDP-N-acetylmuramyl tripeptide synthase